MDFPHFNPRSPHGERLLRLSRLPSARPPFQSTLPARGATPAISLKSRRIPYFNPRSPHGERRSFPTPGLSDVAFQSTLPARGATPCWISAASSSLIFQSTLPARGATPFAILLVFLYNISIHAPRTGSDFLSKYTAYAAYHFNPRSPHGERLSTIAPAHDFTEFQSTLPARGATARRKNPSQ